MSLAAVEALLEKDRLDATSLPTLEAWVNEQVAKNTYDKNANMAVLKLYKFYPDKANKQIVALILLKALMNLPFNDFILCLYLLPQATVRLDASPRALARSPRCSCAVQDFCFCRRGTCSAHARARLLAS